MYSDFMSWLIKTVVGISPDDNASTFEKIDIDPYFFANLKYAKGSYNSVKGEVKVQWEKTTDNIRLIVNAPTDNFVYYKGKALDKGENEFII